MFCNLLFFRSPNCYATKDLRSDVSRYSRATKDINYLFEQVYRLVDRVDELRFTRGTYEQGRQRDNYEQIKVEHKNAEQQIKAE